MSFAKIISTVSVLSVLLFCSTIAPVSAAQAPSQQNTLSTPTQEAPTIEVITPAPSKKEIRKRLKAVDGFKSMPKYIQYSILLLALALGIFITGGIIGLFFSHITQIFWYLGSAAALGSLVFFVLWLAEVAGK